MSSNTQGWQRSCCALFFLALVGLLGCGPNPEGKQKRDSGPLSELAKYYNQATNQLNRAPKSPDELKPLLPPDKDVNSLLNCPVDNEPYVIIWGTDPREGMDLKPLVIGYEAKEYDGSRFVFTAMGVMLMESEDFKTAKFPAGHTPK